MSNLIDKITDDIVTLGAIGAIAYLGVVGVTDPLIIGAMAGLGGYRMRNRQK